MKKISLILASLCGATLVACNSGSDNNNVPSGCANGASQCGAPSAATTYNEQFPNGITGSLISANNIYVSNNEIVSLVFGESGITAPVNVTFSGNNDINIVSNFNNENNSYTLTFTAGSNTNYTITPSVSGTPMAPITVTAIASTSFKYPLGTYTQSSGIGTCVDDNQTFVSTLHGGYNCEMPSEWHEGACYLDNDDGNQMEIPFPSFFYETGGYFNMSWNNGTFSASLASSDYTLDDILECGSNIGYLKQTYISSSTDLPYPIVSDSQLSKKSKGNHSIFGAKFTK